MLTSFQWEPQGGEVAKLRKLIEITPDDDLQKADFWFRLGQTHTWWWEHTPGGAAAAERQRAEAHFSEAIAAYRAATTFKGYDRIDGALFALARLYICADDVENGVAYANRLFQEYPSSRHVPQIEVLAGDYHANHNNLADALGWYSMAAGYNESSVQAYALYRKGWCFLQRGDADAARFAFAEAIRIAEHRTVGSEAARDLAALDGAGVARDRH